jgi:hypothetical protein
VREGADALLNWTEEYPEETRDFECKVLAYFQPIQLVESANHL